MLSFLRDADVVDAWLNSQKSSMEGDKEANLAATEAALEVSYRPRVRIFLSAILDFFRFSLELNVFWGCFQLVSKLSTFDDLKWPRDETCQPNLKKFILSLIRLHLKELKNDLF